MTSGLALSPFDFLDLSFRTDLGILNVRWLRAVTFEELQQGFGLALQVGQERRATQWLVDVRRRTELDATSSAWVAQHLLRQAAASLVPATLYVAYLLSPARAQELRANAALRATTAGAQAPSQPYRLQTFIDEGPATQWLLTTAAR